MSHSPVSPPRITRVSVKKLFGVLDHDVALNRDERVTIVHGINGVGKTKLLELTAALTRGQIVRLAEVPFELLRLELDDGTAIEAYRELSASSSRPDKAARKRTKRSRASSSDISVRRVDVASSKVLNELSAKELGVEFAASGRRSAPPWFEALGNGWWIDSRTSDMLPDDEMRVRYGISAGVQQLLIPSDRVREVVPCASAHLIETQRLIRIGGGSRARSSHDHEDGGALVIAVHEIAAELKQDIAVAQNEFFRRTQALDRTLTERVLKAKAHDHPLGEKLRARLEALEMHRQRLERVGLLDAGAFGPTLPPSDAGALTGDRALMIAVHTDDAEQKFKVLDPLATRLELFLDGMNEKLAYPKRLLLDGDRSLSVQRNGEVVSLEQLSSGEQHELVLLYDLAFRVKPATLVLIDEPELSLHPVWQQQFLEDIIKIAQNGAFDVLIATHSPYIVGNRVDLCVELKPEVRA